MRVLVLDIGNSNVKCAVFDTDGTLIWSEMRPTYRGAPWDMVDQCHGRIHNAVSHAPDIGIVTAFGDAFVRTNEKIPRFVFADEPAELPASAVRQYALNGWPENMEISGIRSLRAKHDIGWEDILPVNTFVLGELDRRAARVWDKTQASVSGEFNLAEDTWSWPVPVGLCESSHIIAHIAGIPFCAGGLDNAFIDLDDTSPYLIAGTWVVAGRVVQSPTLADFTEARAARGVRWLRSATGNLHMQTVRHSVRPTDVTHAVFDDFAQDIFDDFDVMGVHVDWSIRVMGGYADDLAERISRETGRICSVRSEPDFYQLRHAAKFVSEAHEKRSAVAA